MKDVDFIQFSIPVVPGRISREKQKHVRGKCDVKAGRWVGIWIFSTYLSVRDAIVLRYVHWHSEL